MAVLLDLHSMPPLGGAGAARASCWATASGRAAGARFVARVEAVASAAGMPVALNTPYAGGHILDRHGRPAAGMHAIQLELDRSLYLDAALDRPGIGACSAPPTLVRRMLAALADEALGHGRARLAAE